MDVGGRTIHPNLIVVRQVCTSWCGMQRKNIKQNYMPVFNFLRVAVRIASVIDEPYHVAIDGPINQEDPAVHIPCGRCCSLTRIRRHAKEVAVDALPSVALLHGTKH